MHLQGEGSPTAALVFLSDVPPADLHEALRDRRDLPECFVAHLSAGEDWPEVELELNMVWPSTLVTVGEVATQLVLGAVDLSVIHGTPLRVGAFVVIPIHAPSAPPWHVRWACDVQAVVKYLAPVPEPVPEPVVLKPRSITSTQARLWQEADLP